MPPMRRVLALCGCVAVLLAACGGDDAPEERRFEQDGAPFAFAYPPDLVTIQPQLRETERSAPTSRRRSARTRRTTSTSRRTTRRCPSTSPTRRARTRSIAPRSSWPRTRAGSSARASRRSSGRCDAFVYPLEKIDAGREGRPDLRLQRPGGVLRALRVGVRRLAHHPGRLRPGAAVVRAARRRRRHGGTSQPATTTAPASSSGDSARAPPRACNCTDPRRPAGASGRPLATIGTGSAGLDGRRRPTALPGTSPDRNERSFRQARGRPGAGTSNEEDERGRPKRHRGGSRNDGPG